MIGLIKGLELLALGANAVKSVKGGKAAPLTENAPEIVENIVNGIFQHEKRKASVRPMVMMMTGGVSVVVALAGVVAALSPMFGVDQDVAGDMVWNLTQLFGFVGGAYGIQHGARSYDKNKEGKAAENAA